jgi:hypothetical protein
MSAACWYRRLRSFSSDLLTNRSSSAGSPGFRRAGATGARFKIASKISAERSPRKGNIPVAIS